MPKRILMYANRGRNHIFYSKQFTRRNEIKLFTLTKMSMNASFFLTGP